MPAAQSASPPVVQSPRQPRRIGPAPVAMPERPRRPLDRRTAWLATGIVAVSVAVALPLAWSAQGTASTNMHADAPISPAAIGATDAIRIADFRPTDPRLADLGQLLFYDPILSGNRNISCGTCHNHEHASADGLSLPVGEGGRGLGPKRDVGEGASLISERVPRHSPVLFNLGHASVDTMFHDGRLSVNADEPSGFSNPLLEGRRHDLPLGLDGIVAAQAMFPVTSATEMRGHASENDVARDGTSATPLVWDRLAERLRDVPEYVERFQAAFADVTLADDITYAHAANAIADFIETEWRSVDAPFDRWLAGDVNALTAEQTRGAALFYGEAGCGTCHSGPLLTDSEHHAIAMPQIGPGRTRQFSDGAFDRGRMNVSDDWADAFRFRTPTLRNVAATAPYGHSGAYSKLESMVRHHLNPRGALEAYDPAEAILAKHDTLGPLDFLTHENDRERQRIGARLDIEPVDLSDREVDDLVAFLGSLSDPVALEGRRGKPDRVPSGLPVD